LNCADFWLPYKLYEHTVLLTQNEYWKEIMCVLRSSLNFSRAPRCKIGLTAFVLTENGLKWTSLEFFNILKTQDALYKLHAFTRYTFECMP
jgi:hypothetical protein